MSVSTPYRRLAALLLLALPGLAFQCGRECDLCAPCPTERLGRLALQPASQAWLPQAAPDSLRFINSNGFRTALYRISVAADSVPQSASPRQSALYHLLNDWSGAREACGPTFSTERRRLRYEGRRLPLTLNLGLVRNLSGDYPTTGTPPALPDPLTRAVADTLPDAVLVSFNEQSFSIFPVVHRPYRQEFQGVRYLDSVRVAGRRFTGVYRHTQYTAPGSGAVRLRDVFFQPGQGVVGFVYTNNEEWARY